MKLMIASDIHGSATYCSQLLDAYKRENADRMLILGDILYHGPRNDLPDGYAPKEVIKLLNENSNEFFCVRGNCDGEVDQMVLKFPIMADYSIFCMGDRLVYATHGHHQNPQTPPPMKKGDILLTGHTHVPKCEPFGENLYINPGSVSIPKENSYRGYIIWDDNCEETITFRKLDGTIWKIVTKSELDELCPIL